LSTAEQLWEKQHVLIDKCMGVDDKNNAVLCKKDSGFTTTYSNTVISWFQLHGISCSL